MRKLGASSMPKNELLKVVTRPRAQKDLSRIWSKGAKEWGRTQADRYLAHLDEEIESLRRFPEMGVSVADLKPDHRSLHVQRHLVIYSVSDTNLRIIRVLHDSMLVEDHL